MNSFVKPGDTVTLTAAADIDSGDVVQVGQIVGIAANDALNGEPVEVIRRGVFRNQPKETGTAYTEGVLIHWNGTAFSAAALASGDVVVGFAAAAAGSADTVGDIILDGAAREDDAG
jgi:predicted RecA/RadA family phage recombinase